jgi:outer membrane receptor protein involved in Fe transport
LQDEYNTNDNPLNGLRFNLDYQFKPFSFGGLEIGYQYRNLDHKGDFVYERKNNATGLFELVTDFSSEVNLKRAIHAVYTQFNASYEKWNLGAGLRVEQMERDLSLKDKSGIIDQDYKYDFTKLFPSANIVYNINENSNLKLAYSKRIERTTTFKMNPFPEREHSETLERGDPNLRPELVVQIELGVSNKNTRGDALFSTLYYRKVDQLINRVNTVYNDTILNRIYSNVGKGRTFGAEFGSEFSVGEKWKNLASVNVFNYEIKGSFDNKPIDYKSLIYSINLNSTYRFSKNTSLQFTFNYLSDRVTAQGEDSRFYSPNLTFTKRFWNDQLSASIQWKNIDLGLMDTNEQRITTSRPNEFYTTTNYVYEVDVILLSLSYNFNNRKNTSKFIQSEFGKREF